MPKRKYFRRIYVDEIDAAHDKLKARFPNGALPDRRNVWVQVESIEKQEKILALVEFDSRVYVNVLDADSPLATVEIISWADGYLANYPQWEFLVPDANVKMQDALWKHWGLEGEVEPPHKVYIVRRQ